MSHNQSRAERSDSAPYRKTGRSGSSTQQQNFPADVNTKGGGGASSAPSNSGSRSFKKYNNNNNNSNGQGGQSRARSPNVDSDSAANPLHQPTQSVPHVPVTSSSSNVKPTDASSQKFNRAVPKAPSSNVPTAAPTSNVPAANPEPAPPTTPVKGSFWRIVSTKRHEQARRELLRTAPSIPVPSIPKHHLQKKDDQNNTVEPQPVSKPKRDPQISAAAAPSPQVTQTQNPAIHPIPGMPMQLPYHKPQVPVQFGGPGPQIQSQPMSLPMQMQLPIGNPQMQQPMFITGLQPHPLQSQGIIHQGQNFNFSAPMSHQLPPQMGNLGINMGPPQFPQQQQAGKYGGGIVPRKTVKITHPDTHEELRLDGSSGHKSHPNVPPQSQPIASFPPNHPMGFYPNSYNPGNIYFPAASSVSMNINLVPPTSQPLRISKQVTVIAPVVPVSYRENDDNDNNSAVPVSLPSSIVKDKVLSDPNAGKGAAPRGKKKKKDLYKKAEAAGASSDLYDDNDNNSAVPVSLPSSIVKDKVLSDANAGKGAAPRGKKKKKDLFRKTKAAGASSDLYNAYKEEKKEPAQGKVEPDDWEDWEDAAKNSPQLGASKNENLDNDGNGLITKMYSRDFLLKFEDRIVDLPEGFKIPPEVADALMASSNFVRESHPSPGRNVDRPNSRSDRRSSGLGDKDKRNKSPGPIMSWRGDMSTDAGYYSGNNIVGGFRPGQGGYYGVLRNPCPQAPVHYPVGIMPGPMLVPCSHLSDSAEFLCGPPSILHDVSSDKVWPEEQLRDKSMITIKEFYSARDKNEVALCIKDLNTPSFYPSMISIWLADSFERKDKEREVLTDLLINLSKPQGIITEDQLIKGFESVLAVLEDAVYDAPRAAEFLGHTFARVILENIVSLSEIGRLIYEGGEEQGRLVKIGLAADVLGSTLDTIKSEKGDTVLNDIRSGSNLQLENFRPPGSKKTLKIDKFM